MRHMMRIVLCFFFQAEDGIRDYKVTGVQTCALPIFIQPSEYTVEALLKQKKLQELDKDNIPNIKNVAPEFLNLPHDPTLRSEERRVGKEGNARWGAWRGIKNMDMNRTTCEIALEYER